MRLRSRSGFRRDRHAAGRRANTADRPLVKADPQRIDPNGCFAYNGDMAAQAQSRQTASLNIRQLDPALKEQLRIRAAHNGRSMEAEARAILKDALTSSRPASGEALAAAIRRRFAPLGGVDLELPPREPGRKPPHFE